MRTTPTESTVLVIVPTHDHPTTLDLSVQSALAQTHADLDVVIIGDGVGDDTREVAQALVARDERVRFIDRPKSPSRAERVRHQVIMESPSTVVTYLGDDDLLFPDHVEVMTALLADHDFAHPFPVFIDADDQLFVYPTDVSDPRCVEWHLQPHCNAIGLTGASHTVAVYRRLPDGWTEPPDGVWSDHFFWQQLFRQPGARLATADRSTVVKAPADQRINLTPMQRRSAMHDWVLRLQQQDFATTWEAATAVAIRRSAVDTFMSQVRLAGAEVRIAALERELSDVHADLGERRVEAAESEMRLADSVVHGRAVEAQLSDVEEQLSDVQAQLSDVQAQLSEASLHGEILMTVHDELRVQRDDLRVQLDLLTGSRSWRATRVVSNAAHTLRASLRRRPQRG